MTWKQVIRVGPQEIDAHSKRAGEFTELVSIGGKQAFLTKAGNEALTALQAMDGFRFSIESEFFSKAQQYTGNTK